MTANNTENKQWTDPEDYGLPYVEVVPLKQVYTSKTVEERAALVDVDEVKKKTMQAIKTPIVEAERVSRSEFKIEEKKSGNSWIWIAAVLTLIVVVGIIWQMNKSVIPTQDSEEVVSESVEGLAKEENDEVAVNSISAEETQLAESQSNIPDSISSEQPVAQSPQTGTTIDNNATGTMVKVTEKGPRPQFYIVVASLPNEAMAVEEASRYFDRTETIYLIMPYEDSKNYRLAIERSIGFTAMTEELERVKNQYSEALWILKY